MTVVLTYGTFDLFHLGHVRLLKRAKSLGDKLVVGVSSDEFNQIKGKSSIMPYEHREEIVSSIRFVDQVFPEHNWDQKKADIKRFRADILVMGDDWIGKFDNFKPFCDVVYLPRTQDISSTEIKTAMKSFDREKIDELRCALRTLESIVSKLNY